MSDGGKGSAPRPLSVDRKTFEDNWDKIFKKPEWDNYSDLPAVSSYDVPVLDNEEMWTQEVIDNKSGC